MDVGWNKYIHVLVLELWNRKKEAAIVEHWNAKRASLRYYRADSPPRKVGRETHMIVKRQY